MAMTVPQPTIITHNGSFHADEALACWMLKQLPRFAQAEIIRTRDAELIQHYGRGTGSLNAATNNANSSEAREVVVVDVGGVYNPQEHRYDHHQREFTDTFSAAYSIRLSSAGLVYKHFGRDLIAQLLQWPVNDSRVEVIFEKVYASIIITFDGVDNGVPQYPPSVQSTAAYKDATSLSHIVSRLNPFWNEKEDHQDPLRAFTAAMTVCGNHLLRNIQYYGTAWLPVRDTVREVIVNRFTHHPQGRILVFESYVPWKDHLSELEQELGIQGSTALTTMTGTKESDQQPWYVVFPDPNGTWRLQAVAIMPDSFISRKSLPKAWCGIRDAQLDAVIWPNETERAQWKGAVFVHAGGFIGGHATRGGVLEMVRLAVDMSV